MHKWSSMGDNVNNVSWTQWDVDSQQRTRINVTSGDATTNIFVQITFCVLYTKIFLLGAFGNALVCYVVLRNKRMQTVTNLFIMNLALSDVMLCALAVPFTPLYTFLGGWVFGATLCHLVPFVQGVSVYVSSLTLTSIATDRFLVIIYPFHPRMKTSRCLMIIVGVWIIAILLTLPYGIYMQLQKETIVDRASNTTITAIFCEEAWPDESFRKVFSCGTTILQFVLPLFAIAYCYVRVSLRLDDRAKTKPGAKNSKRDEQERERKRRTNRMLISMVLIFAICWLPLNIVNIVDDFYADLNDWSYYRLTFFLSHCLAMSSTCYNPFLYAWLNENFRKEFKQVLPCFFGKIDSDAEKTTNDGCTLEKVCNAKGNNDTQQDSVVTNRQCRGNNVGGDDYDSMTMIALEPLATPRPSTTSARECTALLSAKTENNHV